MATRRLRLLARLLAPLTLLLVQTGCLMTASTWDRANDQLSSQGLVAQILAPDGHLAALVGQYDAYQPLTGPANYFIRFPVNHQGNPIIPDQSTITHALLNDSSLLCTAGEQLVWAADSPPLKKALADRNIKLPPRVDRPPKDLLGSRATAALITPFVLLFDLVTSPIQCLALSTFGPRR